MAALTETTSVVTEFGGNYRCVVLELDGVTGTNTVTVDELSVIKLAIGKLKERPTVYCADVLCVVDTTTTNQVNCTLLEDDFVTASTTGAKDFYMVAVGY